MSTMACRAHLLTLISSAIFIQAAFAQSPDHDDAPKIVEAPIDTKLPHGTAVRFWCKVEGVPIPEIEWFKSDSERPLSSRRNRFVHTKDYISTLYLDDVNDRTAGEYRCEANNGAGPRARASAVLSVYSQSPGAPSGFPRVIEEPSRSIFSVELGRSTKLACSITGNPKPEIMWLKDHVPMRTIGDGHTEISSDLTDPDAYDLFISNATTADSGVYSCLGRNEHGIVVSQLTTIFIRVRHYAPKFTRQPEKLNRVMTGTALNLTCVAVGSPMPKVTWYSGGRKMGPPGPPAIGKIVLELKDIQESANYTCKAVSDIGEVTYTTEVKVEALPDAPTSLQLIRSGHNYAKIKWNAVVRRPDELDPTPPTYLVQYRTGSGPVTEWSDRGADEIGTQLSYELTGLQPWVHYEIRVLAFTQFGRGTPSRILDIKTEQAAPSSPPEEVRAMPVSETSAMIQWDAPTESNGIIEEYEIFYVINQNPLPDNTDDWTRLTSTTKLTVLSGLIRNEVYSVCVRATTSVGEGPLSIPIQFTMTPGVPTAPHSVQILAVSASTISLAWGRPDGSESILSYEIYIQNSRDRQQRVQNVVPPQEHFILNNLYPNTVYNIKIKARSTIGEGPASTTIQATTHEAAPSSPPLNIVVVPRGTASTKLLEVQWSPPANTSRNGQLTGYTLSYVKTISSASDDPTVVEINDPNQLSVMIPDLETWTDYTIRLSARTQQGSGPESDPVIARTGEGVPSAPRNLNVTALNSSAILATWSRPNLRTSFGDIKGYVVYYCNMTEDGKSRGEILTIPLQGVNNTSVIVNGLMPRTLYLFQIHAFTIAGDGQSSKAKYTTTLGQVPTAPRNLVLIVEDEEPIRIRMQWDEPEDSHGELNSYRVTFAEKDNREPLREASVSPSRNYFIAESLQKGTNYEFKVEAKNQQDYGAAAVQDYRTADGVPSGVAQNITATYQTSTTALISWQAPLPSQRNGVIINYEVRCQNKDNPMDGKAGNTSETSLVLDELNAGSKYYIQVVAYTSAGAGPVSDRILYNTMRNRPPAPLRVYGERTTPYTIRVTWTQPPVPVKGYTLHYKIESASDWTPVDINEPITFTDMTNMDPGIAYHLKVQAVSPENVAGQFSQVIVVKEDERSSYDQVQQLNSNMTTATSINLVWRAPQRPSAASYKIEYIGKGKNGHIDQHEPMTINANQFSYSQLLRSLKPEHEYNLTVLVKYEGDLGYTGRRSIVIHTNDVRTPELKDTNGAALIAFSREDSGFNMVYVIVSLVTETRDPDDISMDLLMSGRSRRSTDEGTYIAAAFEASITPTEFKIGDGLEHGGYTNKELENGQQYKAFVRLQYNGPQVAEYYSSPFSSPFTSDGPVAASYSEAPKEKAANIVPYVVAVGVCLVIVLIIIIAVIVIKRRKLPEKEEAPAPQKIDADHPPNYPNDPVELRRMNHSTPGMQKHPPIPVTNLASHIEQLRENDNAGFSQEYESIEPGQQFTWEHSNMEINKPKNRYANVIAYDQTRVVLQLLNGIQGTDYINANYMDGYRKQNAYISTQGPLPETYGDFWRMVWEQRSSTVVMMTKLEERARIKCDMYWPSEGTEIYDNCMHVTITDSMELATYTVRTFQIEREGWAEKREIRQFQFTAWPDHGVPDYPTPLLIFMRRVKASTPSDSGPMIVHCSAGVGRTGAFIIIDSMLERIKHEKTVDIYGHVTCLRAQRNYMVQTEDQYIFVHDALLEAVQSGNTEIAARNLYTHIQKLDQPDSINITGMEREFKQLSLTTKTNPSKYVSASLAVNKFKNRLVNVLPFESNRACLQPIRGVDGSDYINASFIDGYRFKKAYIATQGPLPDTAEDFWRMMWEHNSTIVVMLTKLREMGRDKCHQYWPDTRSQRYQYFVVDPYAEYDMTEYTLREFKVTDARDGQSRTIRLFQFTDWPDQGVPQSGMSFIQFIGQVHKTKEQFGQEGPITVHCSAGAGRTGVFITLSIVLERMRYEGVVDMFQTIKMLRTQRQGMVQTEDQYRFCYHAALEHLASFDQY